MPAPHEPCCDCWECSCCDAHPEAFLVEVQGVASLGGCQDCELANTLYGITKLECDSGGPCTWYGLGGPQCMPLTEPSCGEVWLVQIDVACPQPGVLEVTMYVQFEFGGATWSKQLTLPASCYGPFSFGSGDLVGNDSDCDFSSATVTATGTDGEPCPT